MRGATFSRHKNKVCLLHFFSTLKVFLDFQIGFRLMFIFALLNFRVHQCLDFPLTSFVLRQLELATTIIVKPTVVGMDVAGTALLA
jgi:hypothetical protein